jgi:hypothetical protein
MLEFLGPDLGNERYTAAHFIDTYPLYPHMLQYRYLKLLYAAGYPLRHEQKPF